MQQGKRTDNGILKVLWSAVGAGGMCVACAAVPLAAIVHGRFVDIAIYSQHTACMDLEASAGHSASQSRRGGRCRHALCRQV
jgi:hypothetical protein